MRAPRIPLAAEHRGRRHFIGALLVLLVVAETFAPELLTPGVLKTASLSVNLIWLWEL